MTTLLPGTEVHARGLRWEVVRGDQRGSEVLYRLRGLEGVVLGDEVELLSPFEDVIAVARDFAPERAAPISNWLVYHQAFLLEQALGPQAVLAVNPGRLTVEPYQLVPLLRALRMSRIRLLLADGVGLGKTIQAGLILTELLARRLAHRILIVAPAGPLLQQWCEEMLDRFGLRLDVVDREKLEQVRREEELGTNPFDHLPRAIASPDFLKQEHVLELLERSNYDVIVLDEAHHYTDSGAVGDRDDTQRRRLATTLARSCDALLLLTATPHDGNDRSFASLCELLDPSLVDGQGALRGDRYRNYVVRRLKRHVPGKFRERQVIPCPVQVPSPDDSLYGRFLLVLLQLVTPQLKRAFKERRYSEVLAFIALLKRSVSTAYACARTLEVVAERYNLAVSRDAEDLESRRQRVRTLRESMKRLERFGTVSVQEEEDLRLLGAEEIAQRLADLQREVRSGSSKLAHFASVTGQLDELRHVADECADQDPKLLRLVEEIRAIRRVEPTASVLVYTEYVDSQTAAVKALKAAGFKGILEIRGGGRSDEDGDNDHSDRAKVTDRFQAEDNLILISTDAAAEGLNLHQHCHHILHLELPFNPNRLEQRNGRIDRYGQKLDPIVRYLYLQSTFEEQILFRLIAKVERQRSKLTFVPNTLGLTATTDASAERLLKPLLDAQEQLFSSRSRALTLDEAAETPADDEATRQLLAEIDRSFDAFGRAAQAAAWLGEAGLNAEQARVAEAEQAQAAGTRSGSVSLLQFICNAARKDGVPVRKTDPDVVELALPTNWAHGLEALPGYDADTRTLRLTENLDLNRDSKDRSVGYAGRGHPILRRALDRTRNLSLGSTRSIDEDARVSAVYADVRQPELLCTFVGRIVSRAGREFERMVAVRLDRDANYHFYTDAADWEPLADPERGAATRGVWEKHYADWGETARELAHEDAREKFDPVAQRFLAEHREARERERDELSSWLKARAAEIVDSIPAAPAQGGLFDESGTTAPARWRNMNDPAERLAAMAEDGALSVAVRSEAHTAVDVYRRRLEQIDARMSISSTEVVPIGLLMLIPEDRRGA
jgi:ERCC4-related helicase